MRDFSKEQLELIIEGLEHYCEHLDNVADSGIVRIGPERDSIRHRAKAIDALAYQFVVRLRDAG